MDINMGAHRRHRGDAADHRRRTRTILVILVSTYALDDLPPGARTCGAAAYVNKDELSPRGVRRLWEAGGDPDLATRPADCRQPAAERGRRCKLERQRDMAPDRGACAGR